jgi:hypothetical protein
MFSNNAEEEEGGTGGILAKNDDIIAQYQTTRIRPLWAGYKRYVNRQSSTSMFLLTWT